jgi:hypothetical protein
MQKKLLLILMLAGPALVSHAQVEKNDWLLGGSFSFGTNSNNSNNGSNSSSFTGSNSNLNPDLGWAVGKNSVIGLRGGISVSTNKDASGSKQTYDSYLAGAFWRKFFPINDKVGWYGDLSAAYSLSKNKNTYSEPSPTLTTSSKGYRAGLSPGIYYKPGKKIFLNAGFGGLTYSYYKNNSDDIIPANSFSSKSSNFGINLLNYFSFGVSFILNKEHQM